MALAAVITPLLLAASYFWIRGTPLAAFLLTLLKMFCCKGRRAAGELTGLWFPVSVAELTSKKGPELLTRMLRQNGHLTKGRVTSLRERKLTDGVKGDKAILEVSYSEAARRRPLKSPLEL